MIGRRSRNNTTSTNGSTWPYIVSDNNWYVLKNNGTKVNHSKGVEIDDYVISGQILIEGKLHEFSGKYLGGGLDNIDNFNSPNQHEI